MRLPKLTIEGLLTAWTGVMSVVCMASTALILSGCMRFVHDRTADSGGVMTFETVSPFGRGCDDAVPSRPAEPPEGGTLEDAGG